MKNMSFTHLYGNLKNALSGLKETYQTQCSFRTEICLGFPLFLTALLMPINALDKVLLIFPIFFVWACELINTAVETTVDRISKDWNPLSKRAKDISSALVFIALIQAVFIWAFILWHIFANA